MHTSSHRTRRIGPPLAVSVLLAVLLAACTSDPLPDADLEPGATISPSASEEDEEAGPSEEPSSSPEPSEEASAGEEPSAAPSPSASPSAPPQPTGMEGLTEGASGEPVRMLQQRLTDIGYRTRGVDGQFGGLTAFAVRVFQHDHDLPVTGQVDDRTAAELMTATPEPVLGPGATGEAVVQLQNQLNAGPFDVGPADGQYGTMTAQAVYALQKLHGYPPEGSFGPIERYFLETGEGRRPRLSSLGGTVVEIDIAAQLVSVYQDGQPTVVSHTSTASGETFCTPAGGCRRAVTPRGDYAISRRIDGWRTSELGRLYNPLYFNGGIALHGSLSIPTGPASHGCVRLPMHIAEYAPDLLPNGTPVIVR
jgi:peptidoglycan hydrolase-like protein with peptidoglycan-binding domain